jgi:hypothetical protein
MAVVFASGPARELLLVEEPVPQEGQLVLALPARSPVAGVSPEHWVATITISPSPPREVRDALDQLHQTGAGRVTGVKPTEQLGWPGLRQNLAALAWTTTQRRSLALLAGRTEAALTRDLALSSDDAFLQRLAAGCLAAIQDDDGDRTEERLGWLLESTSLRTLAADLETELEPALQAVLLLHAGEAGRHPASLVAVVGASQSMESCRQRLREENLIFLQDRSPAARVRAHDWLSARHLAVPGYDPLSDSETRRQALDRYLDTLQSGEGLAE